MTDSRFSISRQNAGLSLIDGKSLRFFFSKNSPTRPAERPAGRRAHSPHHHVRHGELLAGGLDEMRRTIREQEPTRPSTRLSTMAAEALRTTANHRHTDAPKLIHLLRSDLDWIVMKALDKDRSRRYETANGLAMDIQRHLSNQPIVAHPPSAFHRFQKLVRRNKLIFAATGAVAVALVLGLAASTWEYLKERKARQRAAAVSDLLQELLGSADRDGPSRTASASVTRCSTWAGCWWRRAKWMRQSHTCKRR